MTNTDLISQLDRSIPLQAAHIASLQDIAQRGERYSNERFDVRMAARGAIGKTEVSAWNAKWVEIWAQRVR